MAQNKDRGAWTWNLKDTKSDNISKQTWRLLMKKVCMNNPSKKKKSMSKIKKIPTEGWTARSWNRARLVILANQAKKKNKRTQYPNQFLERRRKGKYNKRKSKATSSTQLLSSWSNINKTRNLLPRDLWKEMWERTFKNSLRFEK